MSDWMSLADKELIVSSQAGNKGAFAELVCRYRERVQAMAYRFCGDPHLAEDIAQETFIKIWRNLPHFQAGSFPGWVYRITINTAIDYARRTRQTVDLEDVPLVEPGSDPEGIVLRTERAQIIRRAVIRLPLHSRAALILREYEGLSYKEIAAILDIPLGTVMSRLNYARNTLRTDLASLLEGTDAPASR